MRAENEIWRPSHEKVKKFETEVIKAVFPHAKFSQMGMTGSPYVAPNSFKAKISGENLFKDSPYEYKGNGKFIHFTTLFALKSILDNGWIRMSEFGNLMDKNELFYGAKVFENDELFIPQINTIDDLKSNVFCLSACESNDKTQRDAFMWDTYGDKGKGVYIEYEFTCKELYSHVFGEVQYGLNALEPLRQLKYLSEKFKNENENFFPERFLDLILEIQALHKSKRYSYENEVRVLFKKDKSKYEEHEHSSIYQDLNSNQEVKYFSKIYLKGRNALLTEENLKKESQKEILKHYPQIEIKKVVLGYNISVEKKVEIMQFLDKIKREEKNKYEFDLYQITDELEILKMI